jgi:hypothetical protein
LKRKIPVQAKTTLPTEMTDAEIEKKFQLLSNDHSLLKRYACENCFKTGKRGTPFGIKFFYRGSENWPQRVPPVGSEAEAGCVGCGWYDFAKWREALNLKLSRRKVPS